MRVLVFTFEFVPFSGGIATYSREVAAGLASLGCAVRVLAPSYADTEKLDAAAPFETKRMSVRHGGPEFFRFVPGTASLWREIDAFGPDVVLLASDLAHGIGAIVCPMKGVPFVAVVHGSEIQKHFPPSSVKERLQAIPLRRCYERADAVVCVSSFVQGLLTRGGFQGPRFSVIRNGINASLLTEQRDQAAIDRIRDRFDLEGRSTLLTIARIVPRKGQAAMVAALPKVLERHPNAKYVVAGRGPDRERIAALAHSLDLDDAVVFTGEIHEDEKVALLDACDVYVLPSLGDGRRVEGLGIALLEGAARGKPLIGGRHGGVPEIVEDGVTGLLVDPSDPADLANKVLQLLDDPTRARQLGENARTLVERDFLTEKMSAALKALLAAVISPS